MLPSRIELRWLVASHILLATVPTAGPFLPPDNPYLPLLWALSSIPLGQMLVLSFWVGMGAGRITCRLIIALIGCVYLEAWPALGTALYQAVYDTPYYGSGFGAGVAMSWMIVLVIAAVFLVVRRFSELRIAPDPSGMQSPTRVQYSILSILVLTAVVAVLLGLMRSARDEPGWPLVAAYALVFVVFLIDVLCAVWAALSPGRMRWRVSLVFLVASLLGALISVILRLPSVAWWLVPGWMLASVVPVAVVIASLAVLRSCGYRMMSKVRESLVTHQSGGGEA
jgi:hypothetical protein